MATDPPRAFPSRMLLLPKDAFDPAVDPMKIFEDPAFPVPAPVPIAITSVFDVELAAVPYPIKIPFETAEMAVPALYPSAVTFEHAWTKVGEFPLRVPTYTFDPESAISARKRIALFADTVSMFDSSRFAVKDPRLYV
jgi:hypothetical protein